jgi:hypothetical protein
MNSIENIFDVVKHTLAVGSEKHTKNTQGNVRENVSL